VTPFRDAYLEPFTRFATHAELARACVPALRLGWIGRALNVHGQATSMEPPHREELLRGVGIRLRMFLDGL
jgi:hypothetical protein